MGKAKRKDIFATCEFCGAEFKVKRGTSGKYCRKECWTKAKRESALSRYKKRETKFKGVKIRYGKYEDGRIRYKYEHVYIVEQVLGRNLKRGEEVHHINGDKSDNRNRNLLICDTSYHTWLHNRMGELYMKKYFRRTT